MDGNSYELLSRTSSAGWRFSTPSSLDFIGTIFHRSETTMRNVAKEICVLPFQDVLDKSENCQTVDTLWVDWGIWWMLTQKTTKHFLGNVNLRMLIKDDYHDWNWNCYQCLPCFKGRPQNSIITRCGRTNGSQIRYYIPMYILYNNKSSRAMGNGREAHHRRYRHHYNHRRLHNHDHYQRYYRMMQHLQYLLLGPDPSAGGVMGAK